jgi:hypothetical protein
MTLERTHERAAAPSRGLEGNPPDADHDHSGRAGCRLVRSLASYLLASGSIRDSTVEVCGYE